MKIFRYQLKDFKLEISDYPILFSFIGILAFFTFRYEDKYILIGSVLIALIMTLVSTINRHGKIKVSRFTKWYLVFCLLLIISSIWAIDASKIIDIFYPYIMFFLLELVVLNIYIIDTVSFVKALKMLIIAGVFTGIRCLANTDLSTILVYYNRGQFASKLLTEGLNYNYFTTSMSLISVIAVFFAFYSRKKIYYMAYAFLTLVTTLSGSRKAIIISIFGLVAILLLEKRDKKTFKKIFIIFLVIFLIWALLMLVPSFYRAIGSIMEEMLLSIFSDSSTVTDYSLLERSYYRKKAFEVFLNNPIIGVGANNFASVLESINYSHAVYAHNNYLELLADLGVVGFIVYYSFYFKVFLKALKEYRHKNYSIYTVLEISFIICLLIIEYGQITYFNTGALLVISTVFIGYFRLSKQQSDD